MVKLGKWTALTTVLAVLFGVGAAVQLNDPDPARWIFIYLAAAAASLGWRRWRWARPLCALVALVACAWAFWIGAHMAEWVAPAQMFEPMQSRGGAVEQSRELYGLGIIAASMLLLLATGRGRSQK